MKNRLIKWYEKFIIFSYRRIMERYNLRYQKKRKKEFLLHYEIIEVKKGEIKYTLLVFETPGGQLRYNLGRHFIGRNFDDQINLRWM